MTYFGTSRPEFEKSYCYYLKSAPLNLSNCTPKLAYLGIFRLEKKKLLPCLKSAPSSLLKNHFNHYSEFWQRVCFIFRSKGYVS